MIYRALDPAIAGERAFVARSWVESFGKSQQAKLLTFGGNLPDRGDTWTPGAGYWRTWHALVDALLERAHVIVAEDAGLIAGFLCWEPWDGAAAVHYVYTRLSYRGQGVAAALVGQVPAGPTLYTHRSRGLRAVPATWRFSMAPLFGVVERKEAA